MELEEAEMETGNTGTGNIPTLATFNRIHGIHAIHGFDFAARPAVEPYPSLRMIASREVRNVHEVPRLGGRHGRL